MDNKWIIKLKTLMSGPGGTVHPGEEMETDEMTAKSLLTRGYADLIKKPELEIEIATIQPSETTMIERQRGRPKGR
jgi:hypothetical protein